MSQTPPPSVTPVPTPAPQRQDRPTFSNRVDAFVTWLSDHAISEFQALATNVYNNAVDCYNNAVAALGYKNTAQSAATSASNSATAAATSETNAGNSASAASGSAASAAASAAIATSGSNAMPTAITVGGTVDAITADFSPDFVFGDKKSIMVRFAGPNTISNPTLALDGGAAKTIKARGGQALNIGDTIGDGILNWHAGGNYWELQNPGEVAGGVGSVNYLSLAVNKQLVAADMGCIVVSATVPGIALKLPNATTLGSMRLAIIRNTGQYAITLQDYDGNVLVVISPEASVIVWGTSTASTAGLWANYSGLSDILGYGTATVGESVTCYGAVIRPLTSSRALIVYDAGTNLKYTVAAVDGLNIALSTAAIVGGGATANNSSQFDMCDLAPDQFYLVYRPSDGFIYDGRISVDAASAVTFSSMGGNFDTSGVASWPRCTKVADNIVITSWYNSSGSSGDGGYGKVSTWNGSGFDRGVLKFYGSGYKFDSGYGGPMALVDPNKLILTYKGNDSFAKAVPLTITGTGASATITTGTVNTLVSVACEDFEIITLDTLKAEISFKQTGTLTVQHGTVTMSGTGGSATIAAGSFPTAVQTDTPYRTLLEKIDTGNVLSLTMRSSSATYREVAVSGTTSTLGSPTHWAVNTVGNVSSNQRQTLSRIENVFVSAYMNNSNYLTVRAFNKAKTL